MNKRFKRTISAVIASAMILTASAGTQLISAADNTSVTASGTSAQSYKVTSKKVPTYYYQYDKEKNYKTKLFFMNGVNDIPYIEITDLAETMVTLMRLSGQSSYGLTMSKDGDTVTLTRENGFPLTIDFANDTFYYLDFDGFFTTQSKTLIDLVMTKWEQGDQSYILKTLKSTERYGDSILMDAGEYGIDLVRQGDNYYIPLQTFSDLFMTPVGLGVALYNQRSLIFFDGEAENLYSDGKYTALGQIYYGKNSKYATNKVSMELASFSANEFCFAMDHLYGLKEKHNINNFSDLILQKENAYNLLLTNSRKIDRELYSIVEDVLDDNHSSYTLSSYTSGASFAQTLRKKYDIGRAGQVLRDTAMELFTKRHEKYPDGVPVYEEVGDTAYITFDKFSFDIPYLLTYDPDDMSTVTGTFTAMSYAVSQITRKDSPVKNVVLDLSINPGGSSDAAVFAISAFLGNAVISVANANTGALVTNYYTADTNFDGKFNSNDHLAGKGLNLYCLTSGVSFSCGNLLPSVFKESPNVSIIGQKSGGGACAVGTISTATGAVMNISSNYRLSYTKNGSFYDIDEGVEPDYAISKLDHFYDREWLTNYIDSLP